MGIFWKYFRETLRWPLIWKEGPISVLVKGGAAVLDGVRDTIIWLRDQFSPATCDTAYVASHAEARGIVRHTLETDDDEFRGRVVAAYTWWMNGGRQGGLPELLAYFGYTTDEIVNLRSSDPDRWAEFTIALEKADGSGFAETDYALVEWLVNDQKPARSVCAGIEMVCAVTGQTWVYAGVSVAPDVEVWAEAT